MKSSYKLTSALTAALIAAGMLAAYSVPAAAQWQEHDGKYSYTDETTGKFLTGWQKLDGKRYYFDKKGNALTGWRRLSGSKYYFIPSEKGMMATQWQLIDKKLYYFGSDGKMRTGWKKIDGKQYYFGKTGAAATGTAVIDGVSYKFSNTGEYIGKQTTQKFTFSMKYDEVQSIAEKRYTSLYTNKEKNIIYAATSGKETADLFFFGKSGRLEMYGVVSGDNAFTDAFRKQLENAGFAKAFEDSSGLGDIYVKGSQKALLYTGSEYAMYMMLSSSLSDEIEQGNYDSYSAMMSLMTTLEM